MKKERKDNTTTERSTNLNTVGTSDQNLTRLRRYSTGITCSHEPIDGNRPRYCNVILNV